MDYCRCLTCWLADIFFKIYCEKVIIKMMDHCCCFTLRTGSKIWAVVNGFLSLGGFFLGCVDIRSVFLKLSLSILYKVLCAHLEVSVHACGFILLMLLLVLLLVLCVAHGLIDPLIDCYHCRQPSPMSNASRMLRILDLDSLARLTVVSGKVWDEGNKWKLGVNSEYL